MMVGYSSCDSSKDPTCVDPRAQLRGPVNANRRPRRSALRLIGWGLALALLPVVLACGSGARTSGRTGTDPNTDGSNVVALESACTDHFSGWQDAFVQPGQRIITVGAISEATAEQPAPETDSERWVKLDEVTIIRQPTGPKADETPTSILGRGDQETIARVQDALGEGATVYLAVFPYGGSEGDIYSAVERSHDGLGVDYIGPCRDVANQHLDREAASLGLSRSAAFERKLNALPAPAGNSAFCDAYRSYAHAYMRFGDSFAGLTAKRTEAYKQVVLIAPPEIAADMQLLVQEIAEGQAISLAHPDAFERVNSWLNVNCGFAFTGGTPSGSIGPPGSAVP